MRWERGSCRLVGGRGVEEREVDGDAGRGGQRCEVAAAVREDGGGDREAAAAGAPAGGRAAGDLGDGGGQAGAAVGDLDADAVAGEDGADGDGAAAVLDGIGEDVGRRPDGTIRRVAVRTRTYGVRSPAVQGIRRLAWLSVRLKWASNVARRR
jgi:hypothetical protein